MSTTLDAFLPHLPAPSQTTAVEPKCSKCGKPIPEGITYLLKIKGKEAMYCQPCAKEILHPQESTEEF